VTCHHGKFDHQTQLVCGGKKDILIGGELHQLELFEGSNRQNEFFRGVKWTSRRSFMMYWRHYLKPSDLMILRKKKSKAGKLLANLLGQSWKPQKVHTYDLRLSLPKLKVSLP
jgi:hypothetical protein